MKNNKSLGQHWLKDRAILDQIADLARGPQSFSAETNQPVCLEIGPGLGTLTSSLLKRFDKVIAVEFDKNLADNLPKSFPGKNLTVINEDILEFEPDAKMPRYVVAGNIPYYITSPIIKKFLTIDPLPERIVLLIQKEVAERIASDKETVLSLFVKNYAEVALGPVVKKDLFIPPPKVDSQVIILTPRPHPLIIPQAFQIVKLGFNNPRKKLISNLSSLKPKAELQQIFADLNISPDARPADLHLEDWPALYNALH